jgi:hypothetical protein
MHLTLKKEATRPPGFNSLQQQQRFEAFLREFNTERPHEALKMKCPAELYTASPRPYSGLHRCLRYDVGALTETTFSHSWHGGAVAWPR